LLANDFTDGNGKDPAEEGVNEVTFEGVDEREGGGDRDGGGAPREDGEPEDMTIEGGES
jgi:hypothetical protein